MTDCHDLVDNFINGLSDNIHHMDPRNFKYHMEYVMSDVNAVKNNFNNGYMDITEIFTKVIYKTITLENYTRELIAKMSIKELKELLLNLYKFVNAHFRNVVNVNNCVTDFIEGYKFVEKYLDENSVNNFVLYKLSMVDTKLDVVEKSIDLLLKNNEKIVLVERRVDVLLKDNKRIAPLERKVDVLLKDNEIIADTSIHLMPKKPNEFKKIPRKPNINDDSLPTKKRKFN